MKRVLIIAPHPDDEILGCGATIAKHVQAGDEVTVVISTCASIGAPELYTKEGTKKVRKEALDAHQYLGVKETIFLDFPAPALNAFPEYKISLSFSKIIDDIKPAFLYIPYHGDMHQDHKAIYRAALVSARPKSGLSIQKILCYETLSETEWAPLQEKGFVPNCFVDVSATFHHKLAAMKFYSTQLKEPPHARSLKTIEALSVYRGATIGVNYAEAFMIEREIILQ